MQKIKQKSKARHQKKRIQIHKRSILVIIAVIAMLGVMVSVKCVSLVSKNKQYIAQETELNSQIAKEKVREQEIEELQNYVGTNEYIEDVAKGKLGLAYPNEIILKPEN